ncbi:MAG: NADH-quinone oxidoreductase subunit M [bacterium]|nr:NADH-quinone oxidoreductase subunit M [bacterium]
MLTLLVFSPLIGAIFISLTKNEKIIKTLAIIFQAVPFLVSLYLYFVFNKTNTDMQFVEEVEWIRFLNIKYIMGVDGISMPLVLLTTLLSLLSTIASLHINTRVKEYFLWMLILATGMSGVFTSLDLILFYIFWEVTLVPMYFLIGIWGGPKKEYAAIKFFLYTLLGSLFMLLGFIILYYFSPEKTFDMRKLVDVDIPINWQIFIFILLFIGFAIKVPLFPFHTWLPLAHVEAPTAVSVLLAGVLLKMGGYGFIRISFPFLNDATKILISYIAVIAAINIIYGAIVAFAQRDIKRIIAYSSINHMGYAILGLCGIYGINSVIGVNGFILEMFNHGIITGSLFLLVGVIYDRCHTRDVDEFGGLLSITPIYAGIFIVQMLASLGLPGLAGFISEFLCFLGAFPSYKFLVAISLFGVLITAGFFLLVIKKVFLGEVNKKWENMQDLDNRELISIVPLLVLTILLGILPSLILNLTNATVMNVVEVVK